MQTFFYRQQKNITISNLYANYFEQRQQISAMTNWSETEGQRARRVVGARLDGTWPNTRPSPRPRGLVRTGMACYRISALQMLAHMPKFVNWVLEHREDGQDWPCNQDDENLKLPKNLERDPATLALDPNLVTGCVTCRLKTFFQDYWGTAAADPPQGPSAFQPTHASILPLHRLGEKWNCAPPSFNDIPKKEGETAEAYFARRLSLETEQQLSRRRQDAAGQHCADEYWSWLRTAVRDSIRDDNQARIEQFDALFTLTLHQEIRCSTCACPRAGKAPVPYESDDAMRTGGFTNVSMSGIDHLLTALRRNDPLQPDTEDTLVCEDPACGQVGTTTTTRLEAAPHYTRVHMNVGAFVGDAVVTEIKDYTPIQIPPILDLTAHVYAPNARRARPLRYKLISALYHIGPRITGGHWVAGVSRPMTADEVSSLKQARRIGETVGKGLAANTEGAEKSKKAEEPAGARKRKRGFPSTQYHLCNDSRIADFPQTDDFNPLTSNPMTLASAAVQGANAVTLMYERLDVRTRTPRYLSELETALEQDRYYAVGSGAPEEKKTEKEGAEKQENEKEGAGKEGAGKEGAGKEGIEKEGIEKEGIEKEGPGKSEGDSGSGEKMNTEKENSGVAEGEKKAEEKNAEEEKLEGRYPKRRRKAVSYRKMC